MLWNVSRSSIPLLLNQLKENINNDSDPELQCRNIKYTKSQHCLQNEDSYSCGDWTSWFMDQAQGIQSLTDIANLNMSTQDRRRNPNNSDSIHKQYRARSLAELDDFRGIISAQKADYKRELEQLRSSSVTPPHRVSPRATPRPEKPKAIKKTKALKKPKAAKKPKAVKKPRDVDAYSPASDNFQSRMSRLDVPDRGIKSPVTTSHKRSVESSVTTNLESRKPNLGESPIATDLQSRMQNIEDQHEYGATAPGISASPQAPIHFQHNAEQEDHAIARFEKIRNKESKARTSVDNVDWSQFKDDLIGHINKLSNVDTADYTEAKGDKYSSQEHVDHAQVKKEIYENIIAEGDGENKIILRDEDRNIASVTHDHGSVNFLLADDAINDHNITIIIESAKRAALASGKNDILIADFDDDPETGMKLYLAAKLSGVNPKLDAQTQIALDTAYPDTLAAINDPNVDMEKLAELYKEIQPIPATSKNKPS
ncbi:MAG: hypothetical protein HOL58_07420 [Francisellaceae bacterium]|nr:hypothetical protein [Francisellaceae bacterium]